MKFYYFSILVLFSCSHSSPIKRTELEAYIKDSKNGLIKNKFVNGVDISILYKPTDLLVSQELKRFEKFDKEVIDSIANQYINNLYFIVSFSKGNKELESQFASNAVKTNEILRYLNYDIGNRFTVISNLDTIPVLGSVYSRMFGSTGKTSLMITVPGKVISSEELTIALHDNVLGIGSCAFTYRSNDIQNIPQLDHF